jgi:uncharacterized membrane protein YphA (DoxX/SURF4 family)
MAAFQITIQAATALLFLEAAIGKFTDANAFEGVVSGYRLLPRWAEPLAARAIPVAESLLAALLIVGVAAPWPAAAGAGLLTLFALAMAINIGRGRTTIDCGCGRPGQTIGWGRVAKNLVLAGLLLAVQRFGGVATPADWVLGLAAGAALFFLDYAYTLIAGAAPRRGAVS